MTLRERRESLGLSRPALEKKAGITLRTIERYESGFLPMESLPLGKAIKIAKALGIKVEELMES